MKRTSQSFHSHDRGLRAMIGIMDWGIGGLTVYKAMRNRGLTTDVL